MDSKSRIALAKFMEGYNCAQAVLYAFCDDLKIDRDIALRIATGFGGGMGRRGEICGAVSGGIMVLGLRYGRGEKDDRKKTELTYKKTDELMDRFLRKHGSVICKKLLDGCELTTEEGQKQYKDMNLKDTICKPCVQSVVEMVEGMI
jgi:C_GCAxxG_C_C family probable redox protein